MNITAGQPVTRSFFTHHPSTGAITDADALPTGTLRANGTDTAVTVTITKTSAKTGDYTASFTVPSSWAQGDIGELLINATVNAIASKAAIWSAVVGVNVTQIAGHEGAANTLREALKSEITGTVATANSTPTVTFFAFTADQSITKNDALIGRRVYFNDEANVLYGQVGIITAAQYDGVNDEYKLTLDNTTQLTNVPASGDKIVIA